MSDAKYSVGQLVNVDTPGYGKKEGIEITEAEFFEPSLFGPNLIDRKGNIATTSRWIYYLKDYVPGGKGYVDEEDIWPHNPPDKHEPADQEFIDELNQWLKPILLPVS